MNLQTKIRTLTILTIIVSITLFLTPVFASNHPTIKVNPPADKPPPPQFWGTYYYDICAGSEPLKNPTISIVTDLDGLSETYASVNLEPYACTFSSIYLRVKDPNSLKIGFPEIPQLTVKVESILSTGEPDRYSYFLLMCNGDERVTFDVTFTTDMETSKIEYDSGVPIASCASYGINLNAKDKNSFTAQVSPPKLKEKPHSYKEPTIKIPSTLVKELGISYYFQYQICLGEKKLDDSVTFTTDVDTQELVDYTHGDGSPYGCKSGSINMKAKDPKSITAKFTNMTTQMEFEKGEIQTTIKQEQILSEQKFPLLNELFKQYEGKHDVFVTSFNNLYQTWSGKLPENVGSSETAGMCCFTVIWYNDDRDGNTVTSTKGVFDSGPIKLDEHFSYTFSKPGLYPYYSKLYPEIKHAVRVYDPLTDCQIDGGCGGVSKSICKEFGEVDNKGNCISGQALLDAVESEFQRRDQVMEERKTALQEKMEQNEQLQSQIELIYQERAELGKKQYDMEESEYMKQLSETNKKLEPLEIEKSKLEDEIRDLEQDNNVKHICTKSETGFFTCITRTKSTNQKWEDLDESPNTIITQIEQSQDTPRWILSVFKWYEEGKLTENELLQLVKWLVSNKIITMN